MRPPDRLVADIGVSVRPVFDLLKRTLDGAHAFHRVSGDRGVFFEQREFLRVVFVFLRIVGRSGLQVRLLDFLSARGFQKLFVKRDEAVSLPVDECAVEMSFFVGHGIFRDQMIIGSVPAIPASD
jgi:hypothetical protein